MVFAIAFLISYTIVYEIVVVAALDTDFRGHLKFARQFLNEGTGVQGHFLFHLLTAAITRFSGAIIEQSTIVLIAGSIGASAVLVDDFYLGAQAADNDGWLRAFLTLAALVSTAIYLKGFNKIYVGQSSPTVWHNPTSMLLKPFALLAAIYLERIVFDRERGATYAIACVAVIIGMLVKPAFALVMIPVAGALALYMTLPARRRFLSDSTLPVTSGTRNALFVLVGIAALILLAQGYYIYTTGTTGRAPTRIVFEPFKVWSRHSTNVPVSILLATAFPLGVTMLDVRRGVALRGLALAWGFAISGIVIFAAFAERGKSLEHGNFSWGYQISLAILFAFAVRSYLRHWREARWRREFIIVSVLLLMHVASGIYYVYQILGLGRYH